MVDKELLDLLACPACRTPVREEEQAIVCGSCGRRYPIEDDLPVMLIERATPGDADAT